MGIANVKLSQTEFSMVTDAEIILTKNRILSRVMDLFGALAADYREQLQSHWVFSPEVLELSPKIYRGEQYQQLPYVTLDFPRYFTREDILAVRSFFWWGHFFSISLLLTGRFRREIIPLVKHSEGHSRFGDWYVSAREDIWDQDKDTTLCKTLREVKEDTRLSGELAVRPFVKVFKLLPLVQWEDAFDFFSLSYRELLQGLGS